MTTRATPTMEAFAEQWLALYPSAKFAGIVGDTTHRRRGGYHISIVDQVNPDNYSVVRADDKAPPGSWPRDCSSAVDMNLGPADMKLCHGRLVAVWRDRATDPRAKYINGHNGWDGEGSPGRYDWVTGGVFTASADHAWHVHLEWRRRYVNDPRAAEAILSILRGESTEQYVTALKGDATMALSDEDIKKLLASDIDSGGNRYSLGGAILDSSRRTGYLANTWAGQVDGKLAQVAAEAAELRTVVNAQSATLALILEKLDELTADPADTTP